MLPIPLAGDAELDVQDFVRVVCVTMDDGTNQSPSVQVPCNTAGVLNTDYWFDCGTEVCLNGEFFVSNKYRTVEFLSNNLCGINACGEPIYCLPPNSNIRVDVRASTLIRGAAPSTPCAADCDPYAPYSTCNLNGYCEDSTGIYYPQANILGTPNFNGAMDAALNSLDGDRNDSAEGPVNFYNENNISGSCVGGTNDGRICTEANETVVCGAAINCDASMDLPTAQDDGDSYQWSFWISDVIDLEPPVLDDPTAALQDGVEPQNAEASVNLSAPVVMNFNKLMMSSSLLTGRRVIVVGDTPIAHKNINIRNLGSLGTGYWITNEGLEEGDPDGEPDWTKTYLNHSMFADANTYRAQAGSGLRDAYQNCFQDSIETPGDCTGAEPSCCPDGVLGDPQVDMSTLGLTPQGNCP